MTATYNYEMTLALLQRAVDEKGEDYNPRGCYYYDELRQPKCIVGHVLSYIDTDGAISDFLLSDPVYRDGVTRNSTRIIKVAPELERLGVSFDRDALHLMDYTQISQDCNVPWGAALRGAIYDVKGADA
jgi:hypothetical protein